MTCNVALLPASNEREPCNDPEHTTHRSTALLLSTRTMTLVSAS